MANHKLAKQTPIGPLGVIAPPPIQIESPAFTGSLATLFYFVKERKVELADVPLAPICVAYFEYLLQATGQDLEEAATALAALAFLLERKAWGLLPSAEPEPEVEESTLIPGSLPEGYGEAIRALEMFREERALVFFRSPDLGAATYELPIDLGEVGADDLARAFGRLLERAQPKEEANVARARRSIGDTMAQVLRRLTPAFESLETLLPEPFTREDAVYFFLALLELVRLGQARIRLESQDVQFAGGLV